MNGAEMEKIKNAIFKKIDDVRQEKGVTDIEIIEQLKVLGIKVNRNTMNDWRKGKSRTYMDFLGEIATILEVSVEELSNVGAINSVDHVLNDYESTLLRLFRKLDIMGQVDLIAYAKSKVDEAQKEKTEVAETTPVKENYRIG